MLLITLFISMSFAAGNARFNFGYFHINSITNIKSQQQHAGISPVQNQEARITDTMLNYPNPFRLSEGSEIRYTLNTATNVTLYIYSLSSSDSFMFFFCLSLLSFCIPKTFSQAAKSSLDIAVILSFTDIIIS